MRWTALLAAVVMVSAGSAMAVVVVDETFQDDPDSCSWLQNFGCVPSNAGLPGTWHDAGHTVTGGRPDNDWRPHYQNSNALPATGGIIDPLTGRDWSGAPSQQYISSINRTGADTGVAGVYSLDGIIEFTLPNGTPRPAVAGEIVRGSFRLQRQDGNIGFGFTDDIAGLQAFHATSPVWDGTGQGPWTMPTGYSAGGWVSPNYSSNITGQVQFNAGFNGVHTHAVTDLNTDGDVDAGSARIDADYLNDETQKLLEASVVTFEFVVGSSEYTRLTLTDATNGTRDIVQCTLADCHPGSGGDQPAPNPGGPLPMGSTLNSISAIWMTGSDGKNEQYWLDDWYVEIIPEPASLGLFGLGCLLAVRRRWA